MRTHWSEGTPREWWKSYIQLTQVEDALRVTKSDLGIRPIYHQRSDRTEAHILVCFLALAVWRTLQQWMSARGLGTALRKLLQEMGEIRFRVVSTAPKALKVLLHHLKLPLPKPTQNDPKCSADFCPFEELTYRFTNVHVF